MELAEFSSTQSHERTKITDSLDLGSQLLNVLENQIRHAKKKLDMIPNNKLSGIVKNDARDFRWLHNMQVSGTAVQAILVSPTLGSSRSFIRNVIGYRN